jgi:Tol biopolymer transport system component
LTFGPMTWLDWATFTPDGRKILANGENWRGELVRYNRDTNQLEPFLDGISADMLDFSRDGKYVLYAPFPDVTLLRANLDGTDATQVVSLSDHPVNPRWSPDASQIAFISFNNHDQRDLAYVVSAKGGTPIRVLPDNKCCDENDPTWSPDGKRLALWVESREGKIESELRIVDILTHKVTFLPRPQKRTWSPRWSPDGKYIVCLTGPYPNTDGLELYDFKTNEWKVILSELGSGNWPSWSRDSRWIYYMGSSQTQGNRVRFFRISPDRNRPELVVDLPGFRGTGYDWGWFGLDPHDNLLLLRDAGTSEIYALSLER